MPKPKQLDKDPVMGERFGEEGQLEVVSSRVVVGGIAKCAVYCHVCSKDPELFGDGIFYLERNHLRNGVLPCGCAVNRRWSVSQYMTRLKRKCLEAGFEYLHVVGAFKGVDTRVRLKCNLDGYEWNITLDNLFRGKGCPSCQSKIISKTMKKNDEDMIRGFMSKGTFLEGTTFRRSDRIDSRGYARWWYVTCPICSVDEKVESGVCSGVFESTGANLSAGHRPCRCPASGFKRSLPAHLYVLKVIGESNSFTGFGVSNNLPQRICSHIRNLSKEGLEIMEDSSFSLDGALAHSLEGAIKQKFPRNAQDILGFKFEATLLELYPDVVKFVEDQIKDINDKT